MRRSFSSFCYRHLLRLYPKTHRRRFEHGMLQCFEQLKHEPRYTGPLGRARLWLSALSDVLGNASLIRLSQKASPTVSLQRKSNVLDDLRREVVFAARKLVRRPGFTAVAVATIGIAIGANILVFTIVQATLVNPLPYPEPERVVSVWSDHWFTRAELAFFDERMETMQLAGALSDSVVYLGSETPLQLSGLHVSSHYFSALGVQPLIGRSFDADSADASTLVLSYALWQGLFGGDEAVLGKTMTLDDRPFRVIGVMPKGFASLPLEGELWVPMEMDPSSGNYEGTNEIRVIARLTKDSSDAQALDELRRTVQSRRQEFAHLAFEDYGDGATLTPLHSALTRDFRRPLLVLQVAVVFVLLMACVNVANIALAGASTRTGELSLRSALGASRGQIVRQLTMEGVLIAACGAGVGLITALVFLPMLVGALPFAKPDWLTIGVDRNVLLFAAALAFSSVLAFSVFPAMWSSRRTLNGSLKPSRHSTAAAARVRGVLVASEMALAMILVVAAGLMLKSFVSILDEDLGFTTDRIVTLRLHPSPAKYEEPDQSRVFYRQLLERVRGLPGVDDAGITRRLPLTGAWFTRLHLEGLPSDNDRGHPVQWTPADPGYFRTLKLRLEEGTGFDGTEQASSQPVALVNETFASKFWAEGSPVGRRIRFTGADDAWMTIVGVVTDVKQNGPDGFAFPMIYRPFEQSPVLGMRMVARTSSDPLAAVDSIREAVWDIDSRVPISEVATLRQVLSTSLAEPRLPLVGLAVFAAIALVLGAGGLYGVVSHVISQRTYDIGILFALGAQRREVLWKVVGQGMRPVFIGMSIGLFGSVASSRFLASLLHGVSPTDPVVLVSVCAVLTLTAVIACYIPARRASLIDPTVALRRE